MTKYVQLDGKLTQANRAMDVAAESSSGQLGEETPKNNVVMDATSSSGQLGEAAPKSNVVESLNNSPHHLYISKIRNDNDTSKIIVKIYISLYTTIDDITKLLKQY
ncbi:unnamed protein product [Rhizophagus irregularis]|nr:unnamed protein product [Rhizophagus irregularis]